MNISYREAENIKLGAKPIETEKRPLIEEIFTSAVTNWCQEIKRAFDFVTSTSPTKIEGILLSGGSSLLPGFSKYLGLETGLNIEMLNPYGNLEIREKLFDTGYLNYIASQGAVSIGLALRYMGDK